MLMVGKRDTNTSKNERANEILGMRQPESGSNPLFEPIELGYRCPICNLNVKFSEYACMMWCPKCDLDIPSCLCKFTYEPNLSLDPLEGKELIIEQMRIFLDSVRDSINVNISKYKES